METLHISQPPKADGVSITANTSQDSNNKTVSVLSVKAVRIGKLPKIKRKPDSFRPGSVTTSDLPLIQEKPLELHFFIPASHSIGSSEEADTVHQMVQTLGSCPRVGSITSYGISNGTWEITMKLSGQNITDHDDFLSDVFREMMPTIHTLPHLCNGYVAGKSSSWEYRIGSFVADKGGFN